MPKYLILGGNGMLAYAIKSNPYFADNVALDLPHCDITDYDNLEKQIQKYMPEFLINCAAYTDVTKAESELDLALKVNAEGVKNLAQLAKKYNFKLVHYSTDFVFKGDKDIIYLEDMPTNPVNNYGLSKLKGDEYIQSILPYALIIRISWLYGPNGKNFVSIISSLMNQKNELKIVADQYGKTTYTIDVAEATKNLLIKNAFGIYHFANEGISSRYEFSLIIAELINSKCNILPIKATEYPDTTPRPTWSILGTEKYTNTTGQKVRHWKDALKEFIQLTIVGANPCVRPSPYG